MKKYIFLDNWVFSRFSDDSFSKKLSSFLKANDYTILLTSQLIAELYSPNWQEAADRDRGLKAANFISKHSCVIVNPRKVFDLEYSNFPKNLNIIPVELDFKTIKDDLRLETFLGLLRRDKNYLDLEIDIEKWSENLKNVKSDWVDVANRIVDHALQNGTLKQDSNGSFITDNESKEALLTSLDLRLFEDPDVTLFLSKALSRKNKTGKLSRMRGVRVTSLCIWYSYVEIDKANRLKRQGSDIVDYFHLGLVPYCSAFTVDTTMYKLLGYIARDINISSCELYTSRTLEETLLKY